MEEDELYMHFLLGGPFYGERLLSSEMYHTGTLFFKIGKHSGRYIKTENHSGLTWQSSLEFKTLNGKSST